MTADRAGQTGGERDSDQALQNLRELLSGTDNQTVRIVTMLKDLLPVVHHGGQVEHVRRFVEHEIALAFRPAPATALSGPDRDQLRQQLADALPHEPWCHHDMDCCGCTCEDARVLTVEPLLPVVEAHTTAALRTHEGDTDGQ